MGSYLFFASSKRLYSQITEIFDFVWPTATALWNMRWQVQGYCGCKPNATVKDLQDRFVLGSGIHGANIKKACLDQTWEQQQEEFSKFLLMIVISHYEYWVEDILSELGVKNKGRVIGLQFPSNSNGVSIKNGYQNVLSDILLTESLPMKEAFYDKLILHKKNSSPYLNNLFCCYRYFKECRNAIAHNGGVANDKYIEAQSGYVTVATVQCLGVKEVPEYVHINKDSKIQLKIRGVVGLCDIVLRMVSSIDAELSKSLMAEDVFKKYWKSFFCKQIKTLKSSASGKRPDQIKRMVNKLGMPISNNTSELEKYLIREGLVSR